MNDKEKILNTGKSVFDAEINALMHTKEKLGDSFSMLVDMILGCHGKIVFTGIGKSGHIASKLAATFSSLGTPSFYMHPAEALHGDLGMISGDDIVTILSNSGESDEITKMLPAIKFIGSKIVAITCNDNSALYEASDLGLLVPVKEEACGLGLAPTSSTTAMLCLGDAVALSVSELKGFSASDFGIYHPAGALGKRILIKVWELMSSGDALPKVKSGTLLMDTIPIMSSKGLGIISIVDENDHLLGIICDGDLRRIIGRKVDIYSVSVNEVMIKTPKTIGKSALAVDALKYIKENSINNLPVVDDDNVLVGTITWQQIVKAGIVI